MPAGSRSIGRPYATRRCRAASARDGRPRGRPRRRCAKAPSRTPTVRPSCVEEARVEVDASIGRAVERADGGALRPAGRMDLVVEDRHRAGVYCRPAASNSRVHIAWASWNTSSGTRFPRCRAASSGASAPRAGVPLGGGPGLPRSWSPAGWTPTHRRTTRRRNTTARPRRRPRGSPPDTTSRAAPGHQPPMLLPARQAALLALVRDHPERTAHERVDAAEVRVGAGLRFFGVVQVLRFAAGVNPAGPKPSSPESNWPCRRRAGTRSPWSRYTAPCTR